MRVAQRPIRLGLARQNPQAWPTICGIQTCLGVAVGNTVPTRRVAQTLRRDRSPRY